MKKRILLVTGSLNVGGLENVAMDIVRYSDKSQYKFDFLVYGNNKFYYEEEAKKLGCHIIRVSDPQNGYVKFYKELKNAILKNGPYQIVHSHTYFNSGLVVMAAKRVNVPYCIGHSHSIEREGDKKIIKKIVYAFLRKLLQHYCDTFCACSKRAGENVFGKRAFNKKGIVLCNPVNLDQFTYSEKKRQHIRQLYNIDEKNIVLGNVGRLVLGKNQKFLIDIISEINSEEYVLLLVGDGKERKNLEDYARTKKVLKKVIFAGEQYNIDAYLSAMDIFLMSSKHEGLGIVLIEAMVNGLLCIYEDSAIVDEIKKLPNGVSVSGFDTKQWICKIKQLKLKVRCSREKIKIELKKYDIDEFTKKINQIYSQI